MFFPFEICEYIALPLSIVVAAGVLLWHAVWLAFRLQRLLRPRKTPTPPPDAVQRSLDCIARDLRLNKPDTKAKRD